METILSHTVANTRTHTQTKLYTHTLEISTFFLFIASDGLRFWSKRWSHFVFAEKTVEKIYLFLNMSTQKKSRFAWSWSRFNAYKHSRLFVFYDLTVTPSW